MSFIKAYVLPDFYELSKLLQNSSHRKKVKQIKFGNNYVSCYYCTQYLEFLPRHTIIQFFISTVTFECFYEVRQ